MASLFKKSGAGSDSFRSASFASIISLFLASKGHYLQGITQDTDTGAVNGVGLLLCIA